MLQLAPQSRIFLAIQPVAFRKGIDSLAAVCRQLLHEHPLSGAVFVFRHRSATALKILCDDGQGFWLCMKRLSQGRFTWWPTSTDTPLTWCARDLLILLWHGNPERAAMATDGRQVAEGEPRA
jgi:transposase